jgi:hypothetical protein
MRDPDRGHGMTEQRDDRHGQENNDMATESDESTLDDHQRSYQVFMRLLGYSTAGVAAVLILLAIFLL